MQPLEGPHGAGGGGVGEGEGRGLANALLSLAVQAKEDQKLLHY